METTIGFNSSATPTPTEEDGEDDEADHGIMVIWVKTVNPPQVKIS